MTNLERIRNQLQTMFEEYNYEEGELFHSRVTGRELSNVIAMIQLVVMELIKQQEQKP